jgi:hypothetical protein
MADFPSSERRAAHLVRVAHHLLTSGGGNLESTGPTEPISDPEVSAAIEKEVSDYWKTGSGELAAEPDVFAKITASEAVAAARSALNRNLARADAADLTDFESASLEAIIHVTGRPAMRYVDGQVEMPNELGENAVWRVLLATARKKINAASGSVGRVETGDGGRLLGTAWRVGTNLVVTNRHVASWLATDRAKPPSDWKLDDTRTPLVNFGISAPGGSARKCRVYEIAYCAPQNDIDFAVLKLEAGSADCPPALSVDFSADVLGTEVMDDGGMKADFKGEQVYVVGHPYSPVGTAAISKVFGNADGSKRWSPGLVTRVSETDLILEHDCSTLGGNSGSCVLTAGSHAVVGLHFGGLKVDLATGIGKANIAIAFSRLRNHPAVEILRTGGL